MLRRQACRTSWLPSGEQSASIAPHLLHLPQRCQTHPEASRTALIVEPQPLVTRLPRQSILSQKRLKQWTSKRQA